MKYYIKAEVIFRVAGISGPFHRNISFLVNANNRDEARGKFEARAKQDHAHMAFSSAEFDYKEVAEEIQ